MSKLDADIQLVKCHSIWLSGYISATWPPDINSEADYINQDFMPRPAIISALVHVLQIAEAVRKAEDES